MFRRTRREPPVSLELTPDEALVLFDWLHRMEDEDALETLLLRGEQAALWKLSGAMDGRCLSHSARTTDAF